MSRGKSIVRNLLISEISYALARNPLKIEKSRTQNAEVIYPSEHAILL